MGKSNWFPGVKKERKEIEQGGGGGMGRALVGGKGSQKVEQVALWEQFKVGETF